MEETGDRLQQFLDTKELKKSEFNRTTGIDPAQTYRILRNQMEPGSAALKKINSGYPELNLGWLLTGHGSMLNVKLSDNEKVLIDAYRDLGAEQSAYNPELLSRLVFFGQEKVEEEKLLEQMKLKIPDMEHKDYLKLKWHLWEMQDRRRWLYSHEVILIEAYKKDKKSIDKPNIDYVRNEMKLVENRIKMWLDLDLEKFEKSMKK